MPFSCAVELDLQARSTQGGLSTKRSHVLVRDKCKPSAACLTVQGDSDNWADLLTAVRATGYQRVLVLAYVVYHYFEIIKGRFVSFSSHLLLSNI